MGSQRYVVRAVKYLIRLLVLLAALSLLMMLTRTSRVSADQFFAEIFFTTRGLLLLVAVVLMAAFYPKYGYVERSVEGNLEEYRRHVVESLEKGGYRLDREEGNRMFFRAKSPLRRITMLGEDPITVTGADGRIILNGHRKQIVTAEFRLKSFMQA